MLPQFILTSSLFCVKLFVNNKFPIFLYILLASICLFIGCDRKKGIVESKATEIDTPSISWILRRENNIENIDFIYGDEKYVIVDEEWFKENILFGFDDFLFKNGIKEYGLKNDCDDFARAFSFYCRVKYRSLGYMKSSPAIGDFYYKWSSGNQNSLLDGAHAINVGIFLDKSGNKVVRFIEPQKPNKLYSIDLINEEIRKYYVEHVGM